MITEEFKLAFARTADWIEEYPEQIIEGSLAKDDLGREVHPSSTTAVCWCALGRIVKERGIEYQRHGDWLGIKSAYEGIRSVGIDSQDIWSLNDNKKYNDLVRFLRDLAE